MRNKINEEQLSAARAANRQNKKIPLLIRDDGMLFPNVELVARKQNFRPYTGDPKATLEQRRQWLKTGGAGFAGRQVNYSAEPAPFELGKASALEIVAFALEEYGIVLDAQKPINELREDCYRISQIQGGGEQVHLEEEPLTAPSTGGARSRSGGRRGGGGHGGAANV